MKKSLFLAAVLLFAISGFANTTYNNFHGLHVTGIRLEIPTPPRTANCSPRPTAPTPISRAFRSGLPAPSVPVTSSLGGYIATWDGTKAGTLLYSSPMVNYENVGDE